LLIKMNNMKKVVLHVLSVAMLFSSTFLFAQKNGSIEGTIKDGVTEEILPFTSVQLAGTSLGTITDELGNYMLNNVAPGNYTLRISFLGYEEQSFDITVTAGNVTIQDAELSITTIMGEEVVITALALGQVKAINTQIAANTIKNVVSEQKIRELPDANAAEALSRLPGISVVRNGGEATDIKIRGSSSNAVYVNGMRMGGGLGGVSASMIGGIEVSKAFLPDRDADVMGGAVDFKMREAKSGFKKEIWARTGYNGFTKSFKMHDVSVLLSNRFMDDKLGVMLSGNWDRKDRGRDVLSASYYSVGSSDNAYQVLPVQINQVNLNHTQTLNDRYGATLYSDYRLKRGKLFLQSFFNYTNSQNLQNADGYNDFEINYYSTDYASSSYNFLSGVGGEHYLFDQLEVNWNASYSKNENDTPRQLHYNATNRDGVQGLTSIDTSSTIDDFMGLATHDMSLTYANSVYDYTYNSGGDELAAKLDLKLPFSIGKQIAGYIKFGGKYRDLSRYNASSYTFGTYRDDATQKLWIYATERIPEYDWTYVPNGWLGHQAFAVPEDQWEEDFSMLDAQTHYRSDNDKVTYTSDVVKDQFDESLVSKVNNYTNTERMLAGYAMAEFNLWNIVTFTPGVRYEQNVHETTAKYLAHTIAYGPLPTQGEMFDTTGGNTLDEWFPMIHMKVQATKWLDIRLAYTKTASRPGYTSASPRYYRSVDFNLDKGNVNLRPQINTNYDLYFSFYTGKLGLFTAGVFYKEMEDQVLGYSVRIIDPEDYGLSPAYQGKTLNYPINNESPGYMRGLEIDWQTHFSYLPGFLKGIVLNLNFTYMQSETAYPYFAFETVTIPEPPYRVTVGEATSRDNKVVGMPDYVANASLGYEIGGFAGRISAYYQSRTINRAVASDISTDVDRDDVLRLDLQLSQKLKKVPGLMIYLNVNNLTNNPDAQILTHHSDRIVTMERYGVSGDIGVRYKF